MCFDIWNDKESNCNWEEKDVIKQRKGDQGQKREERQRNKEKTWEKESN